MVFILNRAPTKALTGKTPFEAWYGRKPSLSFHQTFDCIGHVKKTKPILTKLEDRCSWATRRVPRCNNPEFFGKTKNVNYLKFFL